MKKIILSTALFFGIFICMPAQTRTPKVTQKQVNQQGRIQQGVQSGQLTPAEAAKLENQQKKINQDKKIAKADGSLTPQERARIHREQQNANGAIYNQKHDGQKR
jgi:hypothetical protein